MSLAKEANWKIEPLAGDDVSCTTKGSGVALTACPETE